MSAALVLLAGCGGSSHPAAQPQAQATQPGITTGGHSSGGTVRDGGGGTPDSGPATTSNGAKQPNAGSGTAVAPGGSAAAGHASEKPGMRGSSSYVWSVTASVTPSCVPAGGTATVHIKTAPNAALAYVAVYNGEKSGAAPPFGYGYGGNADGYSSMQDGSWQDTWVIRADSPRGKARVTVVVASHQTSKQVDAPFTVADSVTGGC